MRSGYLNPAVEILVSRILFFITAIYFIKNLNIEREKREIVYLTPLKNTFSLSYIDYLNSIYAVLRL